MASYLGASISDAYYGISKATVEVGLVPLCKLERAMVMSVVSRDVGLVPVDGEW